MKNIKDNNYIYASTLVRAADGTRTPRERLERALDSRSPKALLDTLREFRIAPDQSDPERVATEHVGSNTNGSLEADVSARIDALLSDALESAVALVKNSAPEPEIYDFLLYKYDCNNIKAAIKCSILNTDGKNLYFSCGTIPPETVIKCVRDRDFKVLPPNMAAAAAEAVSSYEKTGEAREIDLTLDSACFADMEAAARESGVDFFVRYASSLADSVNIRTALRISDTQLSPAAAAALMRRAAVPGGTLCTDIFLSADGVLAARDIASALPLSPIKSALYGADTAKAVNEALDVYSAKLVSEYNTKPFGAEVPACFLINREREIKRYRKLAALIDAGFTKKEILKKGPDFSDG